MTKCGKCQGVIEAPKPGVALCEACQRALDDWEQGEGPPVLKSPLIELAKGKTR